MTNLVNCAPDAPTGPSHNSQALFAVRSVWIASKIRLRRVIVYPKLENTSDHLEIKLQKDRDRCATANRRNSRDFQEPIRDKSAFVSRNSGLVNNLTF